MDSTDPTDKVTFTFTEAERRQMAMAWFQLMVLHHVNGVCTPGRTEEQSEQFLTASLKISLPMMQPAQQELAIWLTEAVAHVKAMDRTPEERKRFMRVAFERAAASATARQIEGLSSDLSVSDVQATMKVFSDMLSRIEALLLQTMPETTPSLQVSEAGRKAWKWPVIDGPRQGDYVASASETFQAAGADGQEVLYKRQLREDGGFAWSSSRLHLKGIPEV
ncbi:hypothetical protein H8F21_14770 [Pseudomonas sp. P66]|uniref:Uncharacterized protein n=1 Tax=Pseudomonas arcuscaelestis TaxID=2710591 RepID=A0ABS2BZ07_9PSED|nr:hypothetical protein [Pseudomonas arcuscaelestis]MBM5458829.1 hypothetical protein [Pseudomonas arcuscaelestis]